MKKKPLKVLLIGLYSGENLSLRLLQPLVKERGHQCSVLFFEAMRKQPLKHKLHNIVGRSRHYSELPLPESYEKLTDFIEATQPDLVGLNVLSMYYHVAVRISRIVRQVSRAVIVWGGPHCTVSPEECIGHADFVCIGEGVTSFPDLIDTLAEGGDPRLVNGFVFLEQGTLVRTPPASPISDMDALPFVDFSGKDQYYLFNGKLKNQAKSIFLPGCIDSPYKSSYHTITAWGCPFKCTFCINSLVKQKFRRRSVENVIAELKEVKAENPYLRIIIFYDDIFTIDKEWCEAFAEQYKREIDLPFFCYSHSKFADPEILEIVRWAGCILINIGLQSGSEKARKIMGRFESNAQIVQAAHRYEAMRRIPYKGFVLQIFYDLLHSNPIDAQEDLEETLALLCQFPKNFVLNFYTLIHFPNYPLTNYLLKEGLIQPDEVVGANYNNEEVVSYYAPTVPDAVTERERETDFYRYAFYLTQYKYFPRWFVKALSEKGACREFFYNRQALLFRIARSARALSIIGNVRILTSYARVISMPMLMKLKRLIEQEADFPA